jgi:hypothetical protein
MPGVIAIDVRQVRPVSNSGTRALRATHLEPKRSVITALPRRAAKPFTDARLRLIANLERELDRLLEEAYEDLEAGAEYVDTELRLDPRETPRWAVVFEGQERWRSFAQRPRRGLQVASIQETGGRPGEIAFELANVEQEDDNLLKG